MNVPLFPLNTVLFPEGPLPLRIFEARYIDMVSRCLKSDEPFGVLLIRDGSETGKASVYEVGTLARIVDFYQGSDGLLGVTAVGTSRFRLLDYARQDDGLNVGRIELIEAEPPLPVPAEHAGLPTVLERILGDLGRLYDGLPRRYDDAVWVGYRLAEIVPMGPAARQRCLESSDTAARLGLLAGLLNDARTAR